MTLFENERNGKYETGHIHMFLNGQIDFSEDGLKDDMLVLLCGTYDKQTKQAGCCIFFCNTLLVIMG